VTVRPLESFERGPVGLQRTGKQKKKDLDTTQDPGSILTYPTMTALFSISASSNGVIFPTSGSGVQSSTSSSTSYSRKALSVQRVPLESFKANAPPLTR
jgi:hypothetical protein